jgi:serine protease AprX
MSVSTLCRWVRAAAAAAAILFATSGGPAFAQLAPGGSGQRIDAHLREVLQRPGSTSHRVIVRVRSGQAAAVQRRLAARGGRVIADHQSLGAVTAVVPAASLAALANDASVLSLSTDAVVRPAGQIGGLVDGLRTTLDGVSGTGTGLLGGLVDTVGNIIDPSMTTGPAVPPAVLRETLGLGRWSGRGVGVAVIDSGLEMSSEFQGRVAAFYDMTGGRTAAATPFDDYGHGTHVAGTIAGSGALSSGREYRGLSPSVHLVVLKVLDANGAGFTSDVIRAVDFAVANRDRLGIRVINLSLGHPVYEPASSDPLVQAVERAARAGLVVVAAAGNLGMNATTGLPGYAGITSPGNAPSAITAGAVVSRDTVRRADDRIADYSSAGPTWYDALVKPDIVAPGHNIVAAAAKRGTLYRTYPQLKAADADYMRLSGTSMAAAVTTAVVAQMIEARSAAADAGDPPLSPNAIKAALHYSAFDTRNDYGLPYDPLRQGAGGLNGRGAIELAAAMDTSAPRGSVWVDPLPLPWTSIGGEAVAWKQTVIWGDAVIWGSTVDVHRTAWGNAVIWGSGTTWGNAVIWGSSVVWTDPQSWSTAVIWGSHTIGHSDGSTVIWGDSAHLTQSTTVWKDLDEQDTQAASTR